MKVFSLIIYLVVLLISASCGTDIGGPPSGTKEGGTTVPRKPQDEDLNKKIGLTPTIINVTSDNENGIYKKDDQIIVRIVFNQKINISGVPKLKLKIGNAERIVNCEDPKDEAGNTIICTLVVLEGDTTDLLAYSGPDALYLEDGDSIKSEVGSLAILILPIPGKAPSLSHNKKIEIDTIAPTVTEVNTDKENGVYGVGESIDIQVNFSEPVKISGILSLTLETGDVDRLITCNLDPDQNVSSITCVYTVQPGDFSIKLDYVEGNSLIISEGSVADQAGNIAVLTPPAPGSINSLSYNKDIQINSISAQVEQVLTHKVDGIYGTGEVIDILVKFNEPVNVTGVPSITLGLDINQNVNYSSGSGTDTLIFTYSVKSGDNTARLDYTSSNALTLNGVDSSTPKTYSNLYFNSLTS